MEKKLCLAGLLLTCAITHQTYTAARNTDATADADDEGTRVARLQQELSEQADTKNAVGRLPIHEAAACGSLNFLLGLVEYASKNNKSWYYPNTDNDGNTPLHLAAHNGHVACALLLNSQDESVLTKKNKAGKTPLELAAERGHRGLITLFNNLDKAGM